METTTVNTERYQTLYTAIQVLAGLDPDYAHGLNGIGFSGSDTSLGHSLAEKPLESWSPKMLRAAWKIAGNYRYTQLPSIGINFEDIPEPPVPTEDMQQAWRAERNKAKEEAQASAFRGVIIDVPTKYRVSEYPDVFVVVSPKDFELIDAIRTLPQRRWGADRDDKGWEVPIIRDNIQPLLDIVQRFNLSWPDACQARVDEMTQGQAVRIEMSRAQESDFEVEGIPPRLSLRPFQKATVEYGVNALKDGGVLYAEEMGLGKTVDALCTVRAMGWKRTLIVMPANLKGNWYRETRKWLPEYSCSIINGKTAPWREAEVVLINQDILTARLVELLSFHWDAIVVDECHNFKNERAQRTKSLDKLAVAVHHRVVLLSGTPVTNRPAEFISSLKLMGRFQKLFGSWYNFISRYTKSQRTSFGWEIKGSQNEKELNDILRSCCYVRHTKKEVLPELPDKVQTFLPFDLDTKWMKEYRRVEEELFQWVSEQAANDRRFYATVSHLSAEEKEAAILEYRREKVNKARRAEHLVKIAALKRVAAQGKLEQVYEWVENFLEDSDEKLIIFAWHVEIVEAIVQKFAKKYGAITIGDKRGPVDVLFQTKPEHRLCVLNFKSGGVGLTLTEASNVAFVEYPWTPADKGQAEDRAHRIGQKDCVTVWNFVAEGTIDEVSISTIETKRSGIDAVTEGHDAVQPEKVIDEIMNGLKTLREKRS